MKKNTCCYLDLRLRLCAVKMTQTNKQASALSQGRPRDAACCIFRHVSNFTTASRGYSATARLSYISDCGKVGKLTHLLINDGATEQTIGKVSSLHLIGPSCMVSLSTAPPGESTGQVILLNWAAELACFIMIYVHLPFSLRPIQLYGK